MNRCSLVLLGMSLVSIALGLILTRQYAANTLAISDLEQRLNWINRTANELNNGSGSIELYNTTETDDLLAIFANRHDVYRVATEATDISQAGIELLATLPNLVSLSFSGEQLGVAGLQGLVKSKSLEQLSLDYTDATGAELSVLAQLPSLTSLRVVPGWKGQELDDVVRALSKLNKLEQLAVGDLVDDNALEKLRQELPGCEVVLID